MNAMSVSPVKPAINPGNHAVPATATNLTKSPSASFPPITPISLIPEAKPVPAVNTAPVNAENSVDLCSKPPTSNGIVSPTPETNIKENSANATQNHNEKSDPVPDLIPVDAPPKPVEVVPEIKNVEKLKSEEPKSVTPSKENSEPVKEVIPATPVESAKEPSKDEKPAPEEAKPESAVVNDVKDGKDSESHQTEIKSSEPIPEPKKETKSTPDKAQDKKESESETNNEKDVQPEGSAIEPPPESSATPKPTKRKAKAPVEPVEDDGKEGRKSKRTRLPTQPYQSPIPELQFIAKLQTPAKATPKPSAEKIIAFFKNEFLAVRNPEGSFYICQAFQNIHRNSSRIKIRWFTNLPNDEFTPDFFDQTEFDCILTNVTMSRVEKDRWKLPEVERTRVENILKRALDVEKGVAEQPSITEEHPDGLDLSLFKDEAQLKKKKKKKSTSPKANKKTAAASDTVKKPAASKSKRSTAGTPVNTSTSSTKKSARLSNQSQTSAKETAPQKPAKPAENKTKKDKKKKKGKKGAGAKASTNAKQNDKAKVWEPSVKSSNSSKVILSLKKETPAAASKTATAEPTTKAATKRTSSVSSRASATSTSPAAVPQKRRKEEPKNATANQPTTNERTGKVRNAGSAVAAKINSAAMRTTKEKERKTSNSSSQRKK